MPSFIIAVKGIMGIIGINGMTDIISASLENIYNQIAEIERNIAVLPAGNITKKKINDKEDKERARSESTGLFIAGAERIELSSTVLETAVLPLNHAPKCYLTFIAQRENLVKDKMRIIKSINTIKIIRTPRPRRRGQRGR